MQKAVTGNGRVTSFLYGSPFLPYSFFHEGKWRYDVEYTQRFIQRGKGELMFVHLSIRWRIVLLTCLGICLSFAIFSFVVRHVLVADHTRQIYAEDVQMTDVLARNIRQYINSAFEVERMVTMYPDLMQRPETEQRKILRNAIMAYPAYELLAITDMSGNQTARSSGVKTNRADRLWFIKFILNRKSDVSSVYHSSYSLYPIITLVQGVYREEQTEGLVMADIRTDELREFIRSYNAYSECDAYLLDQVGTAIACPGMDAGSEEMCNFATRTKTTIRRDRNALPVYDTLGRLVLDHDSFHVDPGLHKVIVSAMTRESGTAEYVDEKGEQQLCSYHAIDMPEMEGRWTLVLVRPYSSLVASMDETWQTLLLAGLLTAALVSVAALIFSRRITRPLSQLIHQAKAVRDGDFSGHIHVSGEGEVGVLAGTFNDMLDGLRAAEQNRLKAENQIREMAFHDNLTKLPNRAYFALYVKLRLDRSMREKEDGAFFFIDADKFKHVNDTYGHGIGDRLLVEFGRRLVEIAGEDNHVCRFGGDEFVMDLQKIRREEAEEKATAIVEAMREVFVFDDLGLFISSSVGVACYPKDASNVDELLRRADAALYKAKRSGRDQAVFYEQGMENELEE